MTHSTQNGQRRILQKNDEHILHMQSKKQKDRQSILPVITNPPRTKAS